MIFVDANYKDNQGHTQVETREMEDLDWDDVNTCMQLLFDWEEEHDRSILYIEIWEEDNDFEPLNHFSREEAADMCNPTMKYCKSIWRQD
jgi:hypothetical protein